MTLRPWAPADAPVLARAWTDPEIAAWNPVPPQADEAAARRWIAGCRSRGDQELALDLVVVTEQSEGDPVGEVGLSGFDPKRRAALVGYWLLPEARGQGRASAALETLVEWAGQPEPVGLGLGLIVARCHPDNPASASVARRCGFVHRGVDPAGHELWAWPG